MWTPATRLQLARDTTPYATCLTDAEWALLAPFHALPAATGRPRLWPMRLVLDGVLYVLRTGCAWAHLPRDLPPPGTVHRWFLRLARAGTFERMMHALVVEPGGSPDVADRERACREASQTAAVVDAQAARMGTVGVAGARGYDPARRVVGRKRHALVDTDGRLLVATVSPASLHNSRGGIAVLQGSRQPWPFLLRCFADRAYAGPRVAGATLIAVTLVGSQPG